MYTTNIIVHACNIKLIESMHAVPPVIEVMTYTYSAVFGHPLDSRQFNNLSTQYAQSRVTQVYEQPVYIIQFNIPLAMYTHVRFYLPLSWTVSPAITSTVIYRGTMCMHAYYTFPYNDFPVMKFEGWGVVNGVTRNTGVIRGRAFTSAMVKLSNC